MLDKSNKLSKVKTVSKYSQAIFPLFFPGPLQKKKRENKHTHFLQHLAYINTNMHGQAQHGFADNVDQNQIDSGIFQTDRERERERKRQRERERDRE